MIRGVQIKAARGLLKMDQGELSSLSGVSIATIQNIENDEEKWKVASMQTIQRIQAALESKGIKFLQSKDNNSLNGIGVRLFIKTDENIA